MKTARPAHAALLCAAIAAAMLAATGHLAAWNELRPGTVSVTIDGRPMVFRDMTAGTLEDLGNGTTRLTVAVADRKQKVEMTVTAVRPTGEIGGEMHLSTDYNEIMMMYKSRSGGFTIMPSVRMARDAGMTYIPAKRGPGGAVAHDGSAKREGPDWSSMGRERRLATGKGVIRNRRMEGNGLFLVIVPVVENGRITELGGSFSGTVKTGMGGRKAGRFITVRDGKFRVPVMGRR